MAADRSSHQVEATGSGLLTFLDYAMEKGYLKVPTGQAMKTACKEILTSTVGDAWESADVAALDMEDTLRRFETLRAMKFSSGSLNTYKARFRKSVQMFADFRTSPGSWRPDVRPRNRRRHTEEPATDKRDANVPGGSDRAGLKHFAPSSHSSGNMITYPFPLRDGVLVALQLPFDLTPREAKRLSAFIDSLAVDEPLGLPAGSVPLHDGEAS